MNSVKARIIADGYDQFFGLDDLRIFWPMFPEHVSIPVKPGEHVYVLFEDADFQHGLWFGKVAGHEDLNRFSGERGYMTSRELSDLFSDTSGGDSNDKILQNDRAASEREQQDGRLAKLYGED